MGAEAYTKPKLKGGSADISVTLSYILESLDATKIEEG